MEDVNKRRRNFISLSELEYSHLKFSFRRVRIHLTRKWVGIITIKTEGTQIHFLSDVLLAVGSLDLKVPNGNQTTTLHMHHAFCTFYVWRKQLLLDNRLRLSACFLSCLLSNPQTAAALQRNTRPSTHDSPLPVYGQETVRPIPLPHYRAGKVSFLFFVYSCQNYNKIIQLNKLPALEVLIFPVEK